MRRCCCATTPIGRRLIDLMDQGATYFAAAVAFGNAGGVFLLTRPMDFEALPATHRRLERHWSEPRARRWRGMTEFGLARVLPEVRNTWFRMIVANLAAGDEPADINALPVRGGIASGRREFESSHCSIPAC